jgi:hypothetical protein
LDTRNIGISVFSNILQSEILKPVANDASF